MRTHEEREGEIFIDLACTYPTLSNVGMQCAKQYFMLPLQTPLLSRSRPLAKVNVEITTVTSTDTTCTVGGSDYSW